jgi:alpha-1,3-glucosyltransferase
MIVWHILHALVPPPADKPDAWVVLNVLIGASGFGLAYAWCTWKLIAQSGLLELLSGPKVLRATPVEADKRRQ